MAARRGPGRPPHPDVLTPTEWEILDLLRHGISRRELARRRGVSLDAIKYHVGNINGKLGLDPDHRIRDWPGIPADSHLAQRRPSSMTTSFQVDGLGQVSLLCSDVARSETFYRDVIGLHHLFTFGDLVFFMVGPTRLFLSRVPRDEWRPSSILYLTVADIHASHSLLGAAGVAFSGAPHRIHTHDDGTEEWMAFFDDPDGNTLALMSRVAAD